LPSLPDAMIGLACAHATRVVCGRALREQRDQSSHRSSSA
jgi:hypothetical protein